MRAAQPPFPYWPRPATDAITSLRPAFVPASARTLAFAPALDPASRLQATSPQLLSLPTHAPQAKLLRNFDVADACLEQLQELDGFVNDKLKGWRADGGAFPTHKRITGGPDLVARPNTATAPMR